MRLERITDPKTIDDRQIGGLLKSGTTKVILQFSKESAYRPTTLEDVNRACKLYGARINVRFWGHYGGKFDCRNLRNLPDVQSLNLDCLTRISNAEEIESLRHLREFGFGVFESDSPDLLRLPSLRGISKLTLADTRKKNIDLAPLADYINLETLFLNSHARNIDTLGSLQKIKRLSLASINNKHSLNFVPNMGGLQSLTLILGGRQNLGDISHGGIRHLEILRVRGLSTINLAAFPNLEKLRIEDQIQLQTLDLASSTHLRWFAIWNCKTFHQLSGIDHAGSLEYLLIGKTAIDPEDILKHLRKGSQHLTLAGYGTRRDQEIKERIACLGHDPAKYLEDSRVTEYELL